MADIHDRGRALAIRMLAPRPQGKGLGLTLRHKVLTGEYDPETGGQGFTWDDSNGSGLRTTFDLEDIDNTYILEGDVEILMSPVKLDGTDMPQPSTNDVIVFDGSSYNVIGVRPGNYAGVDCFYKAHARGI